MKSQNKPIKKLISTQNLNLHLWAFFASFDTYGIVGNDWPQVMTSFASSSEIAYFFPAAIELMNRPVGASFGAPLLDLSTGVNKLISFNLHQKKVSVMKIDNKMSFKNPVNRSNMILIYYGQNTLNRNEIFMILTQHYKNKFYLLLLINRLIIICWYG